MSTETQVMIDLTMQLSEGIAAYPTHGRSVLGLTPVMRHGDFVGKGRHNIYDGAEVSFEVSQWIIGDQAGTHMDAPYHADPESELTIDRIPIERTFGPAIWLDVPTARDRGGITADDLGAALAESGERLEPGDILLIRTGCSDDALADAQRYAATAAGLDKGAAEWVRARGVRLIAIDCVTIESVGSTRTADAHTNLLRPAALGLPAHDVIPVVENLVGIDRIPARRFWFSALPLPLVGASGSPVRAVALVPGPH